jgi:hypothetical protein
MSFGVFLFFIHKSGRSLVPDRSGSRGLSWTMAVQFSRRQVVSRGIELGNVSVGWHRAGGEAGSGVVLPEMFFRTFLAYAKLESLPVRRRVNLRCSLSKQKPSFCELTD